ncbi:MAG: AAA family ATPase, partial [Phycisphaerae bacterium]
YATPLPTPVGNAGVKVKSFYSAVVLRMRWFEDNENTADIYAILPPPNAPVVTHHQLKIKHAYQRKAFGSAITFPFMQGLANLAAQLLSQLVKTNTADEFTEDFQRIFPHVKRLTPTQSNPQNSTVLADVGLPQQISISELGDGVRQALNALLPIPQLQNGVLLCDELAVGIHTSKLPSFMKQLAWMANKHKCQLIATTHSYELLAAAHSAFSGDDRSPDDLSYIRLDRSENGEISATKFDYHALGTAIAENWEIR